MARKNTEITGGGGVAPPPDAPIETTQPLQESTLEHQRAQAAQNERQLKPLAPPKGPPLQPAVMWCSGYDAADRATLCALVAANNIGEAKTAIRASWPEAPSKQQVWRIEEERTPVWLPGDRFPLDGWMLKRVQAEAPSNG